MTGILLIHGFGGSSEEVSSLGHFLEVLGYRVAIPVLAGHGAAGQKLSHAGYRQWIESARVDYAGLRRTCDKVILIGFSMGGLVGAHLNRLEPFDGFVTINTPIYYGNAQRIFQNLLLDFRKYSRKYTSFRGRLPFLSLVEFQKLLSTAKCLFFGVACPALIVQAQDDDTVHPKSGEYLYRRLQGKRKLYRPVRGGHQILQSKSAEALMKKIADFLENC